MHKIFSNDCHCIAKFITNAWFFSIFFLLSLSNKKWNKIDTIVTGPILNPAPDNTRAQKPDYVPAREPINPNNVFGWPSNPNIYPQMPPPQIPLDIPRLPDNRQAFPATPNQNGGMIYNNPPYHPDLTPPPNIGFDFRFPKTTANPKFLDQFFNSKQQRNSSTINNANLNLTLLGLVFLLIYRISNNFAWTLNWVWLF